LEPVRCTAHREKCVMEIQAYLLQL
jgi:hypothetical protein